MANCKVINKNSFNKSKANYSLSFVPGSTVEKIADATELAITTFAGINSGQKICKYYFQFFVNIICLFSRFFLRFD